MEPRPAATVVVARPASQGIEVLLLTRGAGTSFAPGFRVFPGGIVDPEDQDLAERLFGDRAESFRACALRELHEETGFLVTSGGLVARDAGIPLGGLELEPPPPDALPEIAHWVAPEFLPVRFDARFFATAAPPGLEPLVDGHEIEEAHWTSPDAVLEAVDRGEASLMWPTLVTMQQLVGCRTVDDVLALRMEQVPRPDAPIGGAS
jgi:8-oxo-dGTP pyrophosphatase MutT (NUDIX family)